MPEYSFATLSSLDLEYLVRDLLQKHLDCHLESFKSGKDGGVDLRHAKIQGQPWVIQCKRFVETTFSKLKKEIEKEVPKLKKLRPSRYILCTSLPLLPQQKDQLKALLSPYCKSTADIFGNEDLNNLLGQWEEIERKHFKLWLCSEAILQKVLKSEVFNRTALSVEEIQQRISMFVPTNAVERARTYLDQKGYCLIVGIPGIGKTTTAEILLSLHIDEGWEPAFITNAAQGIEVLKKEGRQVVYYDDFLGQTSLDEKLGKNEEDDISRLVKYCSKRPKQKRFLLTTREYLLERATHVHEKLKRSDLNLSQCTIELHDYTKRIRAHILINHLFFFGVRRSICRYLVEKGVARRIVDHRNYNPRVIEGMCERYLSQDYTPSTFSQDFIRFLDDPKAIWESAYDGQLSDDAKELIITFASLGEMTDQDTLKTAFQAFAQAGKDPLSFENRFRKAIRELDGSFLASRQAPPNQKTKFQFHNPSVKDFTDSIIGQADVAREIVLRAVFHSQLTNRDSWKFVESNELVPVVLRTLNTQEPEYSSFANGTVASRTSSAKRLCFWIERCVAEPRLDVLSKEIAVLAERYLLSYESKNDTCESLIAIFDFVKTYRGTSFSCDIEKFFAVLKDQASEAGDFIVLKSFVESLPEETAELLQDELSECFASFASSQLSHVADHAESASEANETIDNILSVLPEFGMDEDDLVDLQAAYDTQAKLDEKEQMEADMREDEYKEMRGFERSSEAEIDHILDSLRE
ncbi:MAG: hypothetical protein R3C53_19150 [Pirellulaceae bacterium]